MCLSKGESFLPLNGMDFSQEIGASSMVGFDLQMVFEECDVDGEKVKTLGLLFLFVIFNHH